ncbi:ABC transporter ATP-binding protein [Oceanimonas baumannii]|uniref:ABC transporter ATP-binding protein n=1 Tax=Oceanimonas baumannii TaxID=129578 RepID=A0A235CMA1_9GAMM|nr:ABC transporter ATP-binding protein [Oceanimonas baumannii]MCC4264555.1 ABC transporter ATP-binding protein [Oceanimonas baumannii]OYD25703.1 ABC transporter ATP-binding protein [Oceanimonas baumannii]TDW57023.1 putative spermidine/putrescine transport system ATP-binding protein [Oceanimonas baumannii]
MFYLEVAHLAKSFGDTHVFSDIHFDIRRGELVTLLGPSGCGKSTLLRSLAGLVNPDHGHIRVAGEDITHLKPQKRGIGMVFQSYALFPNLTVAGNIAFGLRMQKMNRAELNRRVADAVALVGLEGRESHYPAQLSGGQRQRVALARALVVQPRILLLDEPLSALDAPIRKRLREQIRRIQQQLELTTVFVTHDQEEALTMSDRVFVMNQGRIVQADTAEGVYTRPANDFVAGFMGSYNLLGPEQAAALFGMRIRGRLAIRPETIYIHEPGRDYGMPMTTPLPAHVEHHQLLGNVIRYRMRLAHATLEVDTLNRGPASLLSAGSRVELLLPKNELKEVA